MNAVTSGAAAPTVFSFDSHAVRTVLVDGEPWFVSADVCEALDIGNVTMALRRLDDDEQALSSIEGIHSGAGNPTVNIINESGLYSLILGSRKPEAKRFKKWVTAEVLPAIRKTGAYVSQETNPAVALEQVLGSGRWIAAVRQGRFVLQPIGQRDYVVSEALIEDIRKKALEQANWLVSIAQALRGE